MISAQMSILHPVQVSSQLRLSVRLGRKVHGCSTTCTQQRRTPVNLHAAYAAKVVAKVDQKVFSRTLAQRVTNWADDFGMLSAIKADSTVTAMTIISHPPGGLHSQFLVLGDAKGKLYAFNTRGQLALEHDTGAQKPPCRLASLSA